MSLTLHHARMEDKAEIVAFMDANWGEKHPLVHLETYFNYYYVHGDTLQFVYAKNSDCMVAVAGYVRANDSGNPDIWVSLWCAAKGCNGAGLELMEALPRLAGARSMACNNIRANTMPFYTFLGYSAGRLPHYYRLAGKENYKVAVVTDRTILPASGTAALTKIDTAEALLKYGVPKTNRLPQKDAWYVAKRYFSFPGFAYEVYAVLQASGQAEALLVTRTIDVNGTKVLRILDYIGSEAAFLQLGTAIDSLLQKSGAEYADCYCFGIASASFAQIGFSERTADSANIIPNYLTPLAQENTEYYFFAQSTENFTMFKADGDQDKPNLQL